MTKHGSRMKLSSHLLDMKFMQKSKEKCELEAEEDERKLMFNSELTDSMIKGGDKCIIEPSYVPCEQLMFGRMSFKGMNPEIEKIMKDNELKSPEKLKKMDGISKEEMARRYSTLIGSMKKKFTHKRKRKNDDDDEEEERKPNVLSSSERPQRSWYKFYKPRDDA